MLLSSDRFLLFVTPKYYNEHSFTLSSMLNKQVTLVCWLCWDIAYSRMSMKFSDDTRLEPCRAILFLIMTTEWHVCMCAFENSRNSKFLLRIEQSRARIDDV